MEGVRGRRDASASAPHRGSCEQLRRRRPPLGIPRPVRLGGYTEHGRGTAACDWPNAIRHSRSVRGSTASHHAIGIGRRQAWRWRRAYFSQPILEGDRSLFWPNAIRHSRSVRGSTAFFRLHLRLWCQAVGTIGEFFRKMARPAGFEPATLGLEGRLSDRLYQAVISTE